MYCIYVMTLGLLAFVELISLSNVSADCPDYTFKCPTGEDFRVGTCYNWYGARCDMCHGITSEMTRFCRTFSCNGSPDNWYGRNDGCSAGILHGDMTASFGQACAIHDICYATPGRTKRQCDDDFLYNMKQMCRFPGIHNIGIAFCYAKAGIAYLVVRDHGNNFPDFARNCVEV